MTNFAILAAALALSAAAQAETPINIEASRSAVVHVRDLNIDHVLPRSRGGADSWENLVACCLRCNNVKGDRTPQEMSWELRMIPRPPRGVQWTVRGTDRTDPCWEPYLALAA